MSSYSASLDDKLNHKKEKKRKKKGGEGDTGREQDGGEFARIHRGARRLISWFVESIPRHRSTPPGPFSRRVFWIIKKKKEKKKGGEGKRETKHSRVRTRVQFLSLASRAITYQPCLSRRVYGVNWLLPRSLVRSLATRFPPAVRHELVDGNQPTSRAALQRENSRMVLFKGILYFGLGISILRRHLNSRQLWAWCSWHF